MIDFVKIIIKDLAPAALEANPSLDFFDTVNLTTGELKTINRRGNKVTPSKNGSYKGLEFKIYDTGTITLTGSLHKYWNDGAHNYNDFDNEAVLWVLQDLKRKFGIEPKQCILKCLEIGINFLPPALTNDILDNCLLHKTLPFEYQKNSGEGKYKQAQHSQYIVKIYNKALHYQSKGFEIDNEIMRFEIKYTKMEKLNRKGIYSLQDLINYRLQNFKNELINEWQNVLFYDKSIVFDCLSTKLKSRLLEYSNPNYWTGLLSNNQKVNFRKHRNQLNEITVKHSENTQKAISEIMSEKIDFLNCKSIAFDTLTIPSKTIMSRTSKETKKEGAGNSETIHNIKVCKVTGLNIEMQKKGSVLLSHTGLKYYFQTDKKVFEQVKRRYLSKQWHKSDYQIQIKEIAHNIRNTDSNNRIKHNKVYSSGQINMLYQLGLGVEI